MSIAFSDLQDRQIVTEKNYEEILEEVRKILEKTTQEFDDVPF